MAATYQVHSEARGPHWIAWISRTAAASRTVASCSSPQRAKTLRRAHEPGLKAARRRPIVSESARVWASNNAEPETVNQGAWNWEPGTRNGNPFSNCPARAGRHQKGVLGPIRPLPVELDAGFA